MIFHSEQLINQRDLDTYQQIEFHSSVPITANDVTHQLLTGEIFSTVPLPVELLLCLPELDILPTDSPDSQYDSVGVYGCSAPCSMAYHFLKRAWFAFSISSGSAKNYRHRRLSLWQVANAGCGATEATKRGGQQARIGPPHTASFERVPPRLTDLSMKLNYMKWHNLKIPTTRYWIMSLSSC